MTYNKNTIWIVLFLVFSFNVYGIEHEIYEYDDLSKIAASLKSVRNASNRQEALKILDRNLVLLNTYSINDIKKSRSFEALGSLYMYYGFLMNDDPKKTDAAINAFNKALSIRNEPMSHKEIATAYKKKYDEAVLSDNMSEEFLYGEKVYYHLKQYMRLAGVTSESWKERLAYFEVYAPKETLQVKSKK